MTRARGFGRPRHGLIVLLGIAGATVVAGLTSAPPGALLALYCLPAVWGACSLGARAGLSAALLSCGVVLVLAATGEGRFATADHAVRWLDLGIWGVSLVLASYVAGRLHDRDARRAQALEEAYRGSLALMSRVIETAERFSENHSRRVADASVEMALVLGCSESEVEDIRVGGLLHDLGKLEVPAEALAGAAGLTPEELDDVGRHERRGARPGGAEGGTLRKVIPLVACCRERWDGTGQRALEGREIPLGARILAVADAYDTLVTDRAYQKGRSPEEAHTAIREASGTQFDPLVVDVFLRLHGEPAGPEVKRAA